jgi:hypothetical protein
MGQCLSRCTSPAANSAASSDPSSAQLAPTSLSLDLDTDPATALTNDYAETSNSPTNSSHSIDDTSTGTWTTDKKVRLEPTSCMLPVAAYLLELDCAWESRLDQLGLSMTQSQQAGWLEWVETNPEVMAGVVGPQGLTPTWGLVVGPRSGPPPSLDARQLCVYFRWHLNHSWNAFDAVVLQATTGVSHGETKESFHVCGARMIVSDRAESLSDRVFELRQGDRVIRLSGVPLPPGSELDRRVSALRRVHRAGGPTVDAGTIEMLPAAVTSNPEECEGVGDMGPAPIATGLDCFVGLSTKRHSITVVAARVHVSIGIGGILAYPRKPQYRVCMATEPADYVMHHDGHQHLLLTVLKQSRLEMQIELPDATHFVARRSIQHAFLKPRYCSSETKAPG